MRQSNGPGAFSQTAPLLSVMLSTDVARVDCDTSGPSALRQGLRRWPADVLVGLALPSQGGYIVIDLTHYMRQMRKSIVYGSSCINMQTRGRLSSRQRRLPVRATTVDPDLGAR